MKISLDNITKYADFDKKKDARLRNISFDVEQGEFVSIHVKTSKEKTGAERAFRAGYVRRGGQVNAGRPRRRQAEAEKALKAQKRKHRLYLFGA